MLDFRFITFLAVCEKMSFTKAAEMINITQPAVSQHIRALEEQFGKKLFTIVGRQIYLTKEGEELRKFVQSLKVDINRFGRYFDQKKEEENVSFGATLSIGEFTLPKVIAQLMRNNPNRHIKLHVDNTTHLLTMIDKGEIDFAFIEGSFNKREYNYRLYSMERFIPIASHECMMRHKGDSLVDLLNERLLIREKGSGTRAVLEQILEEKGLTVESFSHIDEIGNLNVIKELVKENLGISFMYETATRDLIEKRLLNELPLKDFSAVREFNFVYSLNSQYEETFLKFLEECKNILT